MVEPDGSMVQGARPAAGANTRIDAAANAPQGNVAWAERLGVIGRALSGPLEEGERSPLREEAWLLLNAALYRYARGHASRFGSVRSELLDDAIPNKVLDLLIRIESSRWKLDSRSGPEIAAFLSKVARNTLVDQLRRDRRQLSLVKDDRDDPSDLTERTAAQPGVDEGEAKVARDQFVAALRTCAEKLAPRSRLAWFLRVFLDLPSKQIAEHPEIQIRPSHVDVVLQRARHEIRHCMSARGYEPEDMPVGTFTELWSKFRLAAEIPGGALNGDARRGSDSESSD